MSVEFVAADEVRDILGRVEEGRRSALTGIEAGATEPGSDRYWQQVFEANAAAVLARLGRVCLPPSHLVRYCFYGRRGGDLLVRPFVARADVDVEAVRAVIDWHPPPDSVALAQAGGPTRDVDFLYRHFTFERSATGYFEYWVAMQELWASGRWVHSHVMASAEEFRAALTEGSWQVEHPVERCEPAVVLEADGAELAVLLHCTLELQAITLHRIHIGADQDVRFVGAIPVALGPRGYSM